MPNSYTIETHKHRLAAWAASSASSAVKNYRFPVSMGTEILEQAGFTPEFSINNSLPSPENTDPTHKEWREQIIYASQQKHSHAFTHGIAAKLINCYLKVRFVCGGDHADSRVQAIHPPIDRLLLQDLAKELGGDWKPYRIKAWSKFSSQEYQEVIDLIRLTIPNRPLWEIEKHWIGHQ